MPDNLRTDTSTKRTWNTTTSELWFSLCLYFFGFFNKYNSQFASVNTIFTRLHNSSCVKNYSSSKEYLPNVLDFNSRVNFNFLPSTLVSFLLKFLWGHNIQPGVNSQTIELSNFITLYPTTKVSSSGKLYCGTSRFRGAGPLRIRPEAS